MNKQNIKEHGGVVLVGGCFDFIHFGHITFLKQAKSLGEKLIVMLQSDGDVRRLKGPSRPIHTQTQRAEMLKSLSFVDEVIRLPTMVSDGDYINLVRKINPDIIAVTEGEVHIGKIELQAKLIDAKLVIIPKIHTPSTSQLAKLLGLE